MKQSKREKNLAARQKAFDNLGTGNRNRRGIDTSKGFYRPGSNKK